MFRLQRSKGLAMKRQSLVNSSFEKNSRAKVDLQTSESISFSGLPSDLIRLCLSYAWSSENHSILVRLSKRLRDLILEKSFLNKVKMNYFPSSKVLFLLRKEEVPIATFVGTDAHLSKLVPQKLTNIRSIRQLALCMIRQHLVENKTRTADEFAMFAQASKFTFRTFSHLYSSKYYYYLAFLNVNSVLFPLLKIWAELPQDWNNFVRQLPIPFKNRIFDLLCKTESGYNLCDLNLLQFLSPFSDQIFPEFPNWIRDISKKEVQRLTNKIQIGQLCNFLLSGFYPDLDSICRIARDLRDQTDVLLLLERIMNGGNPSVSKDISAYLNVFKSYPGLAEWRRKYIRKVTLPILLETQFEVSPKEKIETFTDPEQFLDQTLYQDYHLIRIADYSLIYRAKKETLTKILILLLQRGLNCQTISQTIAGLDIECNLEDALLAEKDYDETQYFNLLSYCYENRNRFSLNKQLFIERIKNPSALLKAMTGRIGESRQEMLKYFNWLFPLLVKTMGRQQKCFEDSSRSLFFKKMIELSDRSLEFQDCKRLLHKDCETCEVKLKTLFDQRSF